LNDVEKSTVPRVLALVGMAGAGKSQCAAHFHALGYFQFRFGSIIVDEVVRRGLPLTPENERLVREELRAHEGMDSIAKRALPILQAGLKTHPTIIIDGLYSFSEYKTLMKEFGGRMVVIAVTCDRDLRYQRLATRKERPLTYEEAERRDYAEIENIEKGGPIAIADHTLLNNDAPDALIAALDRLLDKLGVKP
jgi:dephospho-CoA kinase